MMCSLAGGEQAVSVSAVHPYSSADHVHVLHRDYETRSQAIIQTVGTYKYAFDLSTEVLCCAYAVDDEPVQLWTPGDPVPSEFIEAANNPAWIVVAHGAHFEDRIVFHQ
jgi:DNA polymerase bacteriophage-type